MLLRQSGELTGGREQSLPERPLRGDQHQGEVQSAGGHLQVIYEKTGSEADAAQHVHGVS